MYEAVAALLTFNASIYFATGNPPRRRGNEHATIVPYETFEAARDMIAEMQHASAGNVKGIKSAVHLSETALDSYKSPPRLGEHTHEVLTELLGYSAVEVDALARARVVSTLRKPQEA